MKKSTIWFLAIIMALTFMGLLYVQIMYMRNMVRMRNDQFAEGVKRSLYSVTTRLEQDETKHFLDEDMANIETSFLPRYNADGTAVMGTYTSLSNVSSTTTRTIRNAAIRQIRKFYAASTFIRKGFSTRSY